MSTPVVDEQLALNLYEKLSIERKQLQKEGNLPDWYTTGGWQLFKAKYLYGVDTPKQQYERIANTLAMFAPKNYPEWWSSFNYGTWAEEFFNIIWDGDLSPSTPVLANTGTTRGCNVSCANSYMDDSIHGIYQTRNEIADLTKEGFGTSVYMSDVRPRGAKIKSGGFSVGVLPVFKGIIEDMRYVVQGSARRGSCAAYLDITHGDFHELVEYVEAFPDDANIGWIIKDKFIERLNKGCPEATARFQRALKCKMITGKGYFFFVDKVNRAKPQMYIDMGLDIKCSNLCSETALYSDIDHTYTCVLSSMNVNNYDSYKDKKKIFIATVFLDCVCESFLQQAKNIPGLEKAVRATEKGRALGLGAAGFATYLQNHMMPFGSFEAHMFNNKFFTQLQEESHEASRWLAVELGEPEWCVGNGRRHTHTMCIAPTKSTALIMGGISEGISPDVGYTYSQLTPAGEIDRMNVNILKIMKDRGVYDKKHISEVIAAQGSVQGVSWLSDFEKLVYLTAFEINQFDILRLGAARQKKLDQTQSLNLFFAGDADEGLIARVHQEAFMNPDIHSLYYCYSKAGTVGSNGECSACG